MKKRNKIFIACILLLCMVFTGVRIPTNVVKAADATLKVEYIGKDAKKAGYAESYVRFSSAKAGEYYLYWANDKEALKGYYEITKMKVKKNVTSTFRFAENTAIPADATKMIAVEASKAKDRVSVKDAVAVYTIPASKLLGFKSTQALYSFNSYSDIHIDEEKYGQTPGYWWMHSEQHWAQALQYSADKKVDFIISSGDQVTNAKLYNLDREWQAYEYILAQSDYVNPIWESGGNHEVRIDGAVNEELEAFNKASGLNDSAERINSGKSYYTMTEPKTGDLFIFMALEEGYRPAQYDEFTEEQLDWLEETLEENYGKGKNIFLVQHALISKYGAGDDTNKPHYGGSINPELPSAKRFISILEKYKDMVWISGHSHAAFEVGYNYSNNNDTSCHMIHNSSIGNPTHRYPDGSHGFDYTFNENKSEGYLVQTFENAILFNGANVIDQKIYPAYSYIIDGSTKERVAVTEPEFTYVEGEVTSSMLNSQLANVSVMLGIDYRYSSYGQYQTLKKVYNEYKDADTTKMSASTRKRVYSKLASYKEDLQEVISKVNQ